MTSLDVRQKLGAVIEFFFGRETTKNIC